MKMLKYVGAALAGLALATAAQAQDYPTRAVRMLVPYAPGGQADLVIRVLAEKFSAEFGQPFSVVNMPGGGGLAALNNVIAGEPDGYTISYVDSGQWAINGALNPKNVFRKTDFAAVGLFGQTTGMFLAANQQSGFTTLQQVIAAAKAKPGALSYGSPGIGSIHHLVMEDFKARAGIDILHVPYKGNAQTVPALLGGEVPLVLGALATLGGPAKEGKVKILASSRGTRSSMAPEIPTIAELAVPGFGHGAPEGLIVKAGTPQPIIDKLSKAMAVYVKQPDVIERFARAGFEPLEDTSPATMWKQVEMEQELYARIAKSAGMTSN
jgi:tripartite-type tricarboxylate transporter receptor subunit TctC